MRRSLAAIAAASVLLALAGCKPTSDGGAPLLSVSTAAGTTARATTGVTTGATTGTSSPSPTPAKTGTLPDLVGKGLQSAQDTAQAAGFRILTSHDALGRERHQILDRDWKVCTQTPAPGTHTTDVTVALGAVKTDEQCPAADSGTGTPKAGALMVDLRGKAVSAARDTLPSDTSLKVQDASGQNRIVIVESNWQVCSQTPAAGAKLTGQPVTLTVVKFGEKCP